MPTTPYVITGKVYDNTNAIVNGLTLTLTNETNGNTLLTTSNGLGEFIFDLNNLSNGYSDGDWINIIAAGTGSNGKYLILKIVSNINNYTQIKEVKLAYT